MTSSLKHWITPQVIKTLSSEYNAKIELVKFMGDIRLDMGDLTQSGKIIESIWGTALGKLLPHGFSPKNILVLGLGAGSVAKLLSRKWRTSEIVGVEIDPVVIGIGREYFGVSEIENLTIINQDASVFIENLNDTDHYSLVLVDCYLGYKIPPVFEDMRILKSLKNHTDYLLLNRIFWDDYQKQALSFLAKLNQKFTTMTCRTPSNLVISLK